MIDDLDEPEEELDDGWVVPPLGSHGLRIMAEMCSTCIFRPGNRMMLQPGRVKQMLDGVRAEDSYVPCHKTIGTGRPSAVCRGQRDAYQGMLVRMAEEGGWAVYVTEEEVLMETR